MTCPNSCKRVKNSRNKTAKIHPIVKKLNCKINSCVEDFSKMRRIVNWYKSRILIPITIISLGLGFLNFKSVYPLYENLSLKIWFFILYPPLLVSYIIFTPLTIMYSTSFDNSSIEDINKSFDKVKRSFIDEIFPIL